MKIIASLLLIFFAINLSVAQTRVIIGKGGSKAKSGISGTIKDASTNETLVGVTVYVPELKKGTISDLKGNYNLELSSGDYTLVFSMMGFESKEYQVKLLSGGRLNVALKPSFTELEEVSVTAEAPDHNITSNEIGKQVLEIEAIRNLPAFVGEVDILKSITLLPGVNTVGEVSSGFNIRGGNSDQNLILLGGAILYNPTHLFGLFSAFNSDAIKRVTLYKGGVPPKFGGRSSSVLDISYKNGDFGSWKGSSTIGSLSSKALIEGPLIKNRLSILASGRVSYADWILKTVQDPAIKNSSAFFYDANGRVSYILNQNNKVSYTYYRSKDEFSFDSDTSMQWGNQAHIIDWSFGNGERLSFDLNVVRSVYNNDVVNSSKINQFVLSTGIENNSTKYSLDWKLTNKLRMNAGASISYTKINPGSLSVKDPESSINDQFVENERGLEMAGFIDFQVDVRKNISITLGTRYNRFSYLGSKTVNRYEDYVPRSPETILDSTVYKKNEVIKTYGNWDPRATIRWSLSSSASIKASYTRMHQYIHLISNTSAIAPTNIWKLSDSFFEPQIGTQYSLGFFKNLKDNSIETSFEVYYKDMKNLVEYKDGADLVLNNNIETELISGKGRAYGVELFFKKKSGRLNGWISYTYSRSFVKVIGAYDIEQINRGNWFNSSFDKPHNFTTVAIYDITNKWSLSGNITYSTGRPTTYPAAKIYLERNTLAFFDERNGARVPDYMRMDLSVSFQPEDRTKWWGGKYKFSVYNVLGRKNAFSVFFRDQIGSPPQPYKLSVVGAAFPSLSYEFNF